MVDYRWAIVVPAYAWCPFIGWFSLLPLHLHFQFKTIRFESNNIQEMEFALLGNTRKTELIFEILHTVQISAIRLSLIFIWINTCLNRQLCQITEKKISDEICRVWLIYQLISLINLTKKRWCFRNIQDWFINHTCVAKAFQWRDS